RFRHGARPSDGDEAHQGSARTHWSPPPRPRGTPDTYDQDGRALRLSSRGRRIDALGAVIRAVRSYAVPRHFTLPSRGSQTKVAARCFCGWRQGPTWSSSSMECAPTRLQPAPQGRVPIVPRVSGGLAGEWSWAEAVTSAQLAQHAVSRQSAYDAPRDS